MDMELRYEIQIFEKEDRKKIQTCAGFHASFSQLLRLWVSHGETSNVSREVDEVYWKARFFIVLVSVYVDLFLRE